MIKTNRKGCSAIFIALTCLGLFSAPQGAMANIYNEMVNGDLSDAESMPTPFSLDLGLNPVSGSIGGDAFNSPPEDFFDSLTITVGPGQILASVVLGLYVPSGGNVTSGLRVISGTSWDSNISSPNHIGAADMSVANLGMNLLDDPDIGGPLGPGDYVIAMREGTAGQDYGLLFELVNGSLSPSCDFTGEGFCGISDLNAMLLEGPVSGGVAVTPGINDQYDLNGDNTIDNADVDQWLTDAAAENGFASAYKRGDANLDGTVDGPDFLAWNDSKFQNTLLWSDGDFNGDGVVDGPDFLQWNDNKFTSSDQAVAVPEPSVIWIGCWLAVLAVVRCCRTV